MTQEEILKYNKRCVEFLGYKLHFIDKEKTQPYLIHSDKYKVTGGTILLYKGEELKFDSDWNWIMEVVETIEKLDRDDEHGLFRLLRYGSSCNWNNLPPTINGNTPKEAVVQAINQFLIWYNENKTN